MAKSLTGYKNFRLRLADGYRMAVRFNLLEQKCMPYGFPMKVGEIFHELTTSIHSFSEYLKYPFPDRLLDGTVDIMTAWITRSYPTLKPNDRYYPIYGANLGLWTIEETLKYIEEAQVYHMEVIVCDGELLHHENVTVMS